MNGKWITCTSAVETPIFKKVINLPENPTACEIDISGLGYFTLLVNGRKVSDDLFVPAQTNYSPRNTATFAYPIKDTLSHRVLYLNYDITDYVKSGENLFEIILGNGWWRQKEAIDEGRRHYSDRLITAFDITATLPSGEKLSFLSDGTEKAYIYPILKSNLYLGEVTDTRLFSKELEEVLVTLSDFTPELLEKQTCPKDRVIRKLTPKLIKREGEYYTYDVGEEISGNVILTLKGDEGDTVILRFAEEYINGELDFESTRGGYLFCASGGKQIQNDTFILNGERQTLTPMFVWHGFKYFDIKAKGNIEIENVEIAVIHTDLPVTSTFRCDNDILNWLYDAYILTQLNNFHGCVPSDCPTRERLGYTGDGQLCAPAASLTLDAKEAYRKWITDIIDSQCKLSGHIQHTVPLMGGGGGPGGWGGAIIITPYVCYKTFGDISFLEMSYENMKMWLSYMLSHSENHLLVREEEKGWCLGDWAWAKMEEATPYPEFYNAEKLPETFVNTCYLIYQLELLVEIAKALGDDSAIEGYLSLADKSRKALYEAYFEKGHYCEQNGGADAFAIWVNLPESEKLLTPLCERYEKLGTLDTGMFGTYILPEILFKNGKADLAIRLLASENPAVGFKPMIDRGATTIYEYLDCRGTACHPMFGAPVALLFTELLGMKVDSINSSISIAPAIKTPLKYAEGSIETPFGRLSVKFKIEGDKTLFDIAIPQNIPATLSLDGKEIPLNSGDNHLEI